ncbi:MAG: hypothetical protein ACRCZF_14720, partial [Gemmataceae bacterium]
KVYRLEHRLVPPAAFVDKDNPLSPYHPITYRPYFLGEYKLNAADEAELTNPQDPMLYWLVPILPKRMPGKAEKVEDEIDDYLSAHAGYKLNWSRP